MSFDTETLEALARQREITIYTSSETGEHATTIWIGVADDTPFVRSVRGDEGHWYQRALKNPNVRLVAGGHNVDVVAIPARDRESIARADEAFKGKYPTSRSLDAMLLPTVSHTTMRLEAKGR